MKNMILVLFFTVLEQSYVTVDCVFNEPTAVDQSEKGSQQEGLLVYIKTVALYASRSLSVQ
jgi:hypothetical protein